MLKVQDVFVEHKLSESAIIGPSGVRALPSGVAAEQSVHYFCDCFFLLLSVPHIFLKEGVFLRFYNYAQSFK
jgi:hypothetical protein